MKTFAHNEKMKVEAVMTIATDHFMIDVGEKTRYTGKGLNLMYGII